MSAADTDLRQTDETLQTIPARQTTWRRLWQDYQLPVILTLLILSLLLGYVGFTKYDAAIGGTAAPLDILYLTLQLATFESGAVSGPVGWELEIARWLVPIFMAYTAVLAAAALFRRQLQMIKLWFIRDHVVICGLGEKGTLLTHSFRREGRAVVAIEEDEYNPQVPLCRDQGTIVLIGDATELSLLRKAAVHRASHLVAVCGDDGTNAEVAIGAREVVAKRKRKALTCSLHLVNPQLYSLLREQELSSEPIPSFRLELFNIYEHGAHAMLRRFPAFDEASPSDVQSPHILVMGMGALGERLIISAAQSWHKCYSGSANKLHISIVDTYAEAKIQSLLSQYPHMDACCELFPYQLDLGEAEFHKAEFLFNSDGVCDLGMIYICLNDHSLGLQAALRLRHMLDRDQPPIVVRMPEYTGLATLLKSSPGTSNSHRNIHAFGLLARTCTPELISGGTHERLAQILHEAYVQEREKQGDPLAGDRAMVPWAALPEDLKESNRQQVDHIGAKLRAAGYGIKPLTDWDAAGYQFTPQEVELMAQLEHDRWRAERQDQGWVHGPDKDQQRKTHPALLPWESLPDAEKQKNRSSVETLPATLARGGFQIYHIQE